MHQPAIKWLDILNTINDSITIHDRDFNILYANKASEEMLSLALHKILKQKCFSSYHGSTKPPPYCPSCNTLKSGKPCVTEMFEPKLNKYLEIKALPRFDKDKRLIGLVHVVRDITERKLMEKETEESNIALKTLLRQMEKDNEEIKERISSNIRHLIKPYIARLKKETLSPKHQEYLDIIETNLGDVISPFSWKLMSEYFGLTSKEVQIADLIKDGRHDKEIMRILNISLETVKTHRQNIRKKLNIYGKRTNLRRHLLSISQ
jgi:PAS domain S-box-containing protein